MRAKAGFGCAFCLACTRFCTKIRYKKDREQALNAKTVNRLLMRQTQIDIT